MKISIPRPSPPKLTTDNKIVQIILRDFEKVKKLKNNIDQLIKGTEILVHFIVTSIRRKTTDHLLQTTTIWVLINVLRLQPTVIRQIMLSAGVPGVLYEIMRSELLTGATRAYASELCFFLW